MKRKPVKETNGLKPGLHDRSTRFEPKFEELFNELLFKKGSYMQSDRYQCRI